MRRIIGLLVLCLVASACADRADATGPPDIIYGRDLCIECGMLITEPRFAAAYRIDGEARPFDDIGGMLLYGAESGELSAASVEVWVHDRDTGEWIAAGAAHYVIAEGAVTPMGYGVVAFIDPDRAKAYAAEHDTDIHSWTDLFDFSIEPGRLGHDHWHEEHHDEGSE
jgi:copper chaperone NosL